MTRMTGPDCVVMCNLINTYIHTYIHKYIHTSGAWLGLLMFAVADPLWPSVVFLLPALMYTFPPPHHISSKVLV